MERDFHINDDASYRLFHAWFSGYIGFILLLITACAGPHVLQGSHSIQRSEREIAERIIALTLAGAKGWGVHQAQIEELFEKYADPSYFTEDEYLFLKDSTYRPHTGFEARYYEYQWRAESACALLWVTGYWNESEFKDPHRFCEIDGVLDNLRVVDELAQGMKVRSFADILYMAGLYHGYELATEELRISGNEECIALPITTAIVYWRYLAFKWLMSQGEW